VKMHGIVHQCNHSQKEQKVLNLGLAEVVKLEKANPKVEDQKDIANAEKQKDTENTKV